MPEQNLNPDAHEYRLDVLVQHRAKGTEDDFKTFGLALTTDGRECLGESIDDLNSMLSTGEFEVVDGPMAGHCGNCFSALPAQPDTVHLVTIKLPKNPAHDPKNKITAECVISPECTDSTGEHHTIAVRTDVEVDALREKFGHITRIEQVDLPARNTAQPDTVNSVEELEALPACSVIVDKFGDAGLIEYGHVKFAETAKLPMAYVARRYLPATVIYRPVEG